MGGENLIEMAPRQITLRVECDRLLGPHHHGIDEAAHQHDQRQRHVHDADLLVIEARQPFPPQIAPLAEPGDERNHAKYAEHGDQRAAHGDVTVKRQGVNRQLTEHVSSFRTGCCRVQSRFVLELGDAFARHFESTESGREVNWLYWLTRFDSRCPSRTVAVWVRSPKRQTTEFIGWRQFGEIGLLAAPTPLPALTCC